MAVAGVAIAAACALKGPGEGRAPVLAKGGEAVSLQNEGEPIGELVLLPGLGGGEHPADAVYALAGQAVQQPGDALPQRGVGRVPQEYVGGKPGGLDIGVPVQKVSLPVQAEQPLPGQKDIGADRPLDLQMAVVGEHHEIAAVENASLPGRVHQLAQVAVRERQGFRHPRVEQAVLVAGAVHMTRVGEQQVGPVAPEDLRGAVDLKAVVGRVPGRGGVLQAQQGAEDLLQELRGAALALIGQGRVLPRAVLQDFRHQVVDHPARPAGHRPAAGTAAQAGGLGGVKNGLDLDVRQVVVPGGVGISGFRPHVVADAGVLGETAGEEGGVDGVGQAGVDAAHPLDPRALLQQLAEMGQGAQIFQVLKDHGVNGHDDQVFFFHGESSFALRPPGGRRFFALVQKHPAGMRRAPRSGTGRPKDHSLRICCTSMLPCSTSRKGSPSRIPARP